MRYRQSLCDIDIWNYIIAQHYYLSYQSKLSLYSGAHYSCGTMGVSDISCTAIVIYHKDAYSYWSLTNAIRKSSEKSTVFVTGKIMYYSEMTSTRNYNVFLVLVTSTYNIILLNDRFRCLLRFGNKYTLFKQIFRYRRNTLVTH